MLEQLFNYGIKSGVLMVSNELKIYTAKGEGVKEIEWKSEEAGKAIKKLNQSAWLRVREKWEKHL